VRVVATDGTKFDKSGYVTGGSTGSLESAASAFDAREEERLRAERQKLRQQQDVGARGPGGAGALAAGAPPAPVGSSSWPQQSLLPLRSPASRH
jgi:hypothetical protein